MIDETLPSQTVTELRKSVAWMDLVMANLTEGVVVINQEGTIHFCNDFFASVVEKQRIFLLGCNLWDVLPDLRDLLRERGVLQEVKDYTLKTSNSVYIFDVTVTHPVPIINQKVIVLHDITKRKQAEIEKESALAMFYSLIENMQTGVLVETDERIIFVVNKTFCNIFSIPRTPQSLIGVNCSILAEQCKALLADPDLFPRRIDEIIKNRKPVISEEIRFADGRIFERDYIPIFPQMMQFVAHMWQYRDMTERKKMEKIVIQSEKMAAVGQLAAGIAHEINNPLGIILGFAQSITQRIKAGDPLEMPLRTVERESVRCKELVQDLLTFSHVEQGDHVLVDINRAVKDVISLISARANMNSIKIKVDLIPGDPHILGITSQIQQTIINLANNAMDAMPQGGILTIATELFKEKTQLRLCLKVSDTGKGIPPEIQKKVFEPFFTTKEVGKGTGLGLSLVYEIVKRHKGTIELESEVGKGTTFTITLPITEKPNGVRI